jgi:hypothetical protein
MTYNIIKTNDGYMVEQEDGDYLCDANGNNLFDWYHEADALIPKAQTTYAEQAKAWIQNSPYVDIPVGQFTLRFKLSTDRDWGWVWEYMSWLTGSDYLDSAEELYFDGIYNEMSADLHDMEFIDELLEAMKNKPFNQGESK